MPEVNPNKIISEFLAKAGQKGGKKRHRQASPTEWHDMVTKGGQTTARKYAPNHFVSLQKLSVAARKRNKEAKLGGDLTAKLQTDTTKT